MSDFLFFCDFTENNVEALAPMPWTNAYVLYYLYLFIVAIASIAV